MSISGSDLIVHIIDENYIYNVVFSQLKNRDIMLWIKNEHFLKLEEGRYDREII